MTEDDSTPENAAENAPQTRPEPAAAGERIAKVMARAGVASRREAERMIVEGRVTVNGQKIDSPALDILPSDQIRIDGKPMEEPQETRLWLYYKPVGLVTSASDEKGRQTVFDAFPRDLPRVMTVGRLDLNSEGLLLLTNDGELKRRLELPATGWLRRYRVRVNGRPTDLTFDPLRRGVTIDGEDFAPMEVRLDSQQGANAWLTVGIREGRNREIRRAMTHVGLVVNRLIRVGYGPFRLTGMEENEVKEVKRRMLRDQLGGLLTGEVEEKDRDFRERGAEGTRGRSRSRDDDTRPARPARREDGERKPFTRREDGDRKPYARREDGERKPFTRREDGGDRKPYAKREDGERKPFTRREDDDRKPYAKREDGERKPFARREDGDRKPYAKREDGERKPFTRREDGDRKPYAKREDGDRKPYARREDGERKPFTRREDGDRKPYAKREDGERKPFTRREDGDRKPYAKREDGERKPFARREDGDRKPYAKREDGASERPRRGKPAFSNESDVRYADGGAAKPSRGDGAARGEGRPGGRSFAGKPGANRSGADKAGSAKPRGEAGEKNAGKPFGRKPVAGHGAGRKGPADKAERAFGQKARPEGKSPRKPRA